MTEIGILANPTKPRALTLAAEIGDRLASRARVVYADETAERIGGGRPHAPLTELDAEVVVAVGGDGTFLHAARSTAAPILPINAGTVGVLAELHGDSPTVVEETVDRLLTGRYSIEARLRLAVRLPGAAVPDATNEVAIHNPALGRMGIFEIGVDGRPVGRLRADGLLLATPTGSTAYSLSAHGPIVDPVVEAIVVSPLAPFRTPVRSVVLDPHSEVTVRPVDTGRGALVQVDGDADTVIPDGTQLTVYRSARRTRLVRFGAPFIDRLRGKGILPWVELNGEVGSHGSDVPPPA
ncbi:MAG: NAD(+)/NADH kinase [Thermoplasmata archaeon]